MLADTGGLSSTVRAMRPMVPAKDFDTSKQFYIELGFQPRVLADRLVEMQLAAFSSSCRTTTCVNGPTISWCT